MFNEQDGSNNKEDKSPKTNFKMYTPKINNKSRVAFVTPEAKTTKNHELSQLFKRINAVKNINQDSSRL